MANTESKKVAGLIDRFLNLSPEDQENFDHAYSATKRAIARYNGTMPEIGRRRGRPRKNLPFVPPEEICREIVEEEALALADAVPEPSPVMTEDAYLVIPADIAQEAITGVDMADGKDESVETAGDVFVPDDAYDYGI